MAVIIRNDHTKVDLDQARLFPTDDVENVYNIIAIRNVEKHCSLFHW